MCPQTRTQCLFTNWLGNLSKILKVLRPFLYLSRLTLTLLTQIFWHLWFNENTPPLHCPPPTREPQLPIWFKSLFNIFLWQIKNLSISFRSLSWSYWINLILFYIFYWQLYSSLLSNMFLDRYLLFLTWSTPCYMRLPMDNILQLIFALAKNNAFWKQWFTSIFHSAFIQNKAP